MLVNNTTIQALGNITTPADMVLYSNEISGGAIGLSIMIIVMVVFTGALIASRRPLIEAFGAGAFATGVVAVLMRFISYTSPITGQVSSLVGDKLMWASVLICAIIVFIAIASKD